jgi:hypothetical protein
LNETSIIVEGNTSEGNSIRKVFTIVENGYFEIKGLDSGNYTLTFNKTGYDSYSLSFNIQDEKIDINIPLNIYLEGASGSISGIILNPEQKPEESVTITLTKIGAVDETSAAFQSTQSKTDGVFKFENVNPGEYILNASKDVYFYLDKINVQEGESKDLKIVLKKKVKTDGTLKVQDKNIPEQPLIFINSFTQNSDTVRPDSSGYFEVYLIPGVYTVRLGETNLSKQINIPENKDSFELEILF